MALTDPYWTSAADAALAYLSEADYMLAPVEFLPLNNRFAPLEYSWGLNQFESRLAFCCSKVDFHRIAPWLASSDITRYCWANEVFVLGGNFDWSPKRADQPRLRRHLPAWFANLEDHRKKAGQRARARRLNLADVLKRHRSDRQGILGNKRHRLLRVAEDSSSDVSGQLLAEAFVEHILNMGAEVHGSGTDINPYHLQQYDHILVDARKLSGQYRESPNWKQLLADSMKFGPLGYHYRVPASLLGIDGDVLKCDTDDQITSAFIQEALRTFRLVIPRDRVSTETCQRYGAKASFLYFELLLASAERLSHPSKITRRTRIGLTGDLYRFRHFRAWVESTSDRPFTSSRHGFDYLVLSTEDLLHAERLQQTMLATGRGLTILDLRNQDSRALALRLSSYLGIVTSRADVLALSVALQVPVIALDDDNGDCTNFLRELDESRALILEKEEQIAHLKLEEVLSERLTEVEASRSVASARNRLEKARMPIPTRKNRGLRSLLPLKRRARRDSRHVFQSTNPFEGLDVIPLCWAASTKDTSGFANLGDSLSAVVVAALSGRPVKHTSFQEPITKLVAVGSIGHAIRNGEAVVWGSGVSIRRGMLARNAPATRYDVRAIRGRLSAEHLRAHGISVPNVFGDPVWLLPSIVHEPVEKRYELGVIPHIHDIAYHSPEATPRAGSLRYLVDEADRDSIAVINTWHEPTWAGLLAKLNLIRSCKRLVSQSFHGVVIGEAYQIPVLNFRHQPGAKNGVLQVDLNAECRTDPRVWEFFECGRRPHFHMYSQQRNQRTDWEAVINAVDRYWEPFHFDVDGLVEAFPARLAYNPLTERNPSRLLLEAMFF